jgi:hypothetical protein
MAATVNKRPPTGEGLTFEKVWAMFQENARESAERRKELDRQMKESSERFDKQMKETALEFQELKEMMKETREQMKETDRQISKLGGSFGEMVEHLVAPSIMKKFNERGFNFTRCSRDCEIKEPGKKNIIAEVDIMLENGDKAMVVEVNTKLTVERINSHISRLEKIRKYADLHGDKRTFLGAVAGVVVTDEARNHALNQGFYLIEPSGESFIITPPQAGPKEW